MELRWTGTTSQVFEWLSRDHFLVVDAHDVPVRTEAGLQVLASRSLWEQPELVLLLLSPALQRKEASIILSLPLVLFLFLVPTLMLCLLVCICLSLSHTLALLC
jgi:hypothetical protein